jgi:hypothetical protein
MKLAKRRLLKVSIVVLAFGMAIALGVLTSGKPLSTPRVGAVEDWSNHRLVFSNPGTAADALAHGRFEQWYRIVNDQRFRLQWLKRSSGRKTLLDTGTDVAKASPDSTIILPRPVVAKKPGLNRDWTETLIADGQVQPNMYPAKYSFSTTAASCSADFVVYPTGVAGGTGAANIIAYYNMYTGGCSGTVPSVYWAYNTGTGYMVTTSPVVSNDSTGSQVAYIQSNGTTASLVILKWAASTTETLTAPGTLTVQSSASAYRSCTAPCFYSVSLGANDTFSAPFYDYAADDAIYVGDDSGRLHKITGVFSGTTIAEASGFPVTLNATYKVASPVYDPSSGYVFVGNTDAVLYSVGSGNAGTTAGSTHGTSSALGGTGAAIVDAPLVDSSAGMVYAFVSNDSSGYNGVFQFATSFTSGAGLEEEVGAGATEYWLYDGAFDNVYYSSTNGTAGNLWVVGNTGNTATTGTTHGAYLYRIPISNTGAMGTPVAAISNFTDNAARHYPWPSPITEFCNNGTSACTASGTATTAGTDYLFFSVDRLATATANCGTARGDGCILVYSINTPTNTPTAVGSAQVTTLGTPGCWSTSGIVVDNALPAGSGTGQMTGASQIYLLELNGNGAGGPTHGTYTSSTCAAGDTATPIALQGGQTAP